MIKNMIGEIREERGVYHLDTLELIFFRSFRYNLNGEILLIERFLPLSSFPLPEEERKKKEITNFCAGVKAIESDTRKHSTRIMVIAMIMKFTLTFGSRYLLITVDSMKRTRVSSLLSLLSTKVMHEARVLGSEYTIRMQTGGDNLCKNTTRGVKIVT